MKKYSTFKTLKSLENFISDGGTRLNNKTKQINPKLPVITTITVVKNSEAQIKKTIKSILNQNYDNIEIIVIDGNSDDKTLNEIKKYENKIDYWCCIKDRGIYDAMNYGLMLSSGEVICIINSGDTFKENALNIVSNYFINNNNLSFLFGTVERHYLGNNMILNTGFNAPTLNVDISPAHALVKIPVIGELIIEVFFSIFDRLGSTQGNPESWSPEIAELYGRPVYESGNFKAPLAMMRMVTDGPNHPSTPSMQKIEKYVESLEIPAEIVWGMNDPILGKLLPSMQQNFPKASVTKTSAGHFLQEEVPEEIAEALVRVIDKIIN